MRKLLSKWFCTGASLWIGLALVSAATHNVVITSFRFTPRVLTVTNGDTVIWTGGMRNHTVSPRPGVTEPFCGSGTINSCTVTFNNVGSFRYRCNEHPTAPYYMTGVVHVVAASLPPVVSITNPPHNALFAAPATVNVEATASDSDGSVTSVRFLTNGAVVATNTLAPYRLALSNLVAGNYSVRAHATDNQSLSATSAPVNIRVVAPPALVFERGTNGPLQLFFATVTGVNYVVEGALMLTNFLSLATNPGSGGAGQYSESNGGPAQRFYRLRLE